MAIKSGITLTETDPANIPTPSTGKDTIFMDATASPPAPAYKDDSGVVTSLIGPTGPVGPAGPTGSITVNPNGALDGDGSGGSPLGVRVDGTTIGINASNELEALGAGSGTVINDATLDAGKTVVGNGGAHVTVSALTGDLVDSATGTLGAVSVGSGLQKSGGVLSAHVDNETVGVDSTGKLEVIQPYAAADGALALDQIVVGQGGTHVKTTNTPALGTPTSGTLTNCTGYPISNSTGACSADTNGTTDTMVDVTGATITLAAGTWLLMGAVTVQTTSQTYCVTVIADGSNTVLSSAMGASQAGTSKIANGIAPVVVTPAGSTTYKLRFQTGLNGTAAIALKDVDGTNVRASAIVALRLN